MEWEMGFLQKVRKLLLKGFIYFFYALIYLNPSLV